MRSLLILLFVLLVGQAFAQVKISQATGGKWVLEDHALRVTLDPHTVAFKVLDKRCGRTWHGTSAAPPASYGVTFGAATQADPWPGPAISLTAADQTEGSSKPAPADLSATLNVAWRADALLVRVQVRDNAVFFPKPDATQWWNWDSIEFWVGGQQYAVLPAPPGGTLIAMGKGPVKGARVTSKLVAGGWETEFSLPWPSGKAPGASIVPFALGVNDADADNGQRKSQLYFPRSWRHSTPETFARARFAEKGQAPHEIAQAPATLTDIAELPTHDGLRMTGPACSVSGGHLWQASLTLRLEGSDVVVGIDKTPRDFNPQVFTAFSPLASNRPAELYGAAYCDGLAVPDTDMSFKNAYWTAYGGIDMPWVGYGTPGGAGYALLFEDPDDAGAILEPRGDDGRLVPVAYHWPQMAKFGYARTLRYGFFDRGGFVSMCKWYRKYAASEGILKTLQQKLAIRPQLARIKGAPDIWGSNPSICYDMRRYGIRHAIANGPFPADDMRKIEAQGWLVSRYDNYEDMLEGPRDKPNSGRIPQDVEKHEDGSPVKAWLTWDKKTQYYKQCSLLYVGQARILIPKDLATHPYNARFIDVTTACGLRQCWDKVHPHTRTQDREARQRLAAYIANDLKLVLGGEHGKWWGIPYYDYFEGMQSANRTSWPAGYVGVNLPQKRSDLKPQDWKYGVGYKIRVPLWRLVFGDCTVSTWYWGDSTGHIYKAAPDYADRQDCFNILCGTVPLYWVNQPYGFKWSDPALRLRLLQSYYVTCPVTEQTAFAEMTGFRYLTPDRAVQQTTFSSGVTVTVNFGEKPYTIRAGKTSYVLPYCGFLATGKNVLAWRATVDGRTLTWVDTPTALYADAAGKTHDFGMIRTDGRCAVEIVEPGNVRVIRLTGSAPAVDFSTLGAKWGAKGVHVYAEDEDMSPDRDVAVKFDGARMQLPDDVKFARVIFGQAFDRPNLAITSAKLSASTAKQGETVKLTVRLRNNGGKGTGSAFVALYLDRQDKAHLLDTRRTDIAGESGVASVTFSVATSKLDGAHKLIAVADPDDLFHEPSRKHLVATVDLDVVADPALWPHHVDFEVAAPSVAHRDFPLEVDLTLPAGEVGDPSTARVVRMEGDTAVAEPVAQLEPASSPTAPPNGRWTVVVIDNFPAGKPAHYRLLYGKPKTALTPPEPISFDKVSDTITAPAYTCRFDEGRLVDLASRAPGAESRPIAQHIASSDAAFEWSSEKGTSAQVVATQVGPAKTVVRVSKKLNGGFEFTKTWTFYPTSISLTCDINKPVGVWSRTGIAPVGAHYVDSAGNHAIVDSKGDAEGVGGTLKWYCAYTDKWGFTAISISPKEAGVSYWDAGVGDVGFTTPQTQNLRAMYVVHGGETSPTFAASDYAAYTEPLEVTVSVR